jgi:hypothetical protein
MITSDRHRSLFEKLNPCQARNASQFRLGGVASDEHFGADVLGGGNVDKIPGPGGGTGSMARAQFISPFQKIGQMLDARLQPLRGFAGTVCFPKHKDLLADWTALRLIMRQVERKLAEQYKLVPLE